VVVDFVVEEVVEGAAVVVVGIETKDLVVVVVVGVPDEEDSVEISCDSLECKALLLLAF
jgi:hypothetical protein